MPLLDPQAPLGLMLPSLGVPELLVVLGIAVLLFGPRDRQGARGRHSPVQSVPKRRRQGERRRGRTKRQPASVPLSRGPTPPLGLLYPRANLPLLWDL